VALVALLAEMAAVVVPVLEEKTAVPEQALQEMVDSTVVEVVVAITHPTLTQPEVAVLLELFGVADPHIQILVRESLP
jgi:hypothetical protein